VTTKETTRVRIVTVHEKWSFDTARTLTRGTGYYVSARGDGVFQGGQGRLVDIATGKQRSVTRKKSKRDFEGRHKIWGPKDAKTGVRDHERHHQRVTGGRKTALHQGIAAEPGWCAKHQKTKKRETGRDPSVKKRRCLGDLGQDEGWAHGEPPPLLRGRTKTGPRQRDG